MLYFFYLLFIYFIFYFYLFIFLFIYLFYLILFIYSFFLYFLLLSVSLYAASVIAGTFINATIPLFFELSCEASYPVAEGLTGAFLTFFQNLVGIFFLLLLFIPSIGEYIFYPFMPMYVNFNQSSQEVHDPLYFLIFLIYFI